MYYSEHPSCTFVPCNKSTGNLICAVGFHCHRHWTCTLIYCNWCILLSLSSILWWFLWWWFFCLVAIDIYYVGLFPHNCLFSQAQLKILNYYFQPLTVNCRTMMKNSSNMNLFRKILAASPKCPIVFRHHIQQLFISVSNYIILQYNDF